jgi:uncharacterized SAM-binding protein YcdF (DUF218 family)
MSFRREKSDYGYRRSVGRALFCGLAFTGLLFIIVVATPIDKWWAHALSGSIDQPHGDILILLSAANDDDGTMSYSSYWRARYALRAWRAGDFKTIVISGGEGSGIRNFLVAEGIPADAILDDWQSNSTRENAIDTAQLTEAMAGRKVLLTSDFHMFRAVRVFRKAGLNVTPYAIPDVIKISDSWYGRISGFQRLAVETVKIGYYELRGWM